MLRWATPLCRTVLSLVLTMGLLSGCATPPPPALPAVGTLLHDDSFAPAAAVPAAGHLFTLSTAMRGHLASAPAAAWRSADARRHLIELLYRQQTLLLRYDASATRTAAETFEARAGNCLSLVIMTAAFAKELGLPIQYRSVRVEDTWSRNGGLYVASGHVNLALLSTVAQGRFGGVSGVGDGTLIVDFLPPQQAGGLRSQPIGEATVVAMFMNNRAAEALSRGSLAEAYWHAREAVRHDGSFVSAYNTLGVVYLRAGHPAWAQQVFEAALQREPLNAKVMANQVQALHATGRAPEARALAARLARIEPEPPFHHFEAGLAAMAQHDYRAARAAFTKELARQGDNAEVHFWLARAQIGLGLAADAARHLDLARRNSTTPGEQAAYAAKLDRLRTPPTSPPYPAQ